MARMCTAPTHPSHPPPPQDADGKDVYRSYTPISDDKQKGRVDFVIKLYPQVWSWSVGT